MFMRGAVFWDVSIDFLRFRQRLVVVELLRSRFLLLLQEHQLCIEPEAAFFWQITCCPFDREEHSQATV